MNEKSYKRAELHGLEVRQRGGKKDRNPYRNKPTYRVLEGAWDAGWQYQDRISRGQK